MTGRPLTYQAPCRCGKFEYHSRKEARAAIKRVQGTGRDLEHSRGVGRLRTAKLGIYACPTVAGVLHIGHPSPKAP